MSTKKRKRDTPKREQTINGLDTSKPTAIFKPTEGRAYTLSVAIPSSIIKNAQSPDLKTQLAGRIARALAVFCVDEVVVFEDGQDKDAGKPRTNGHLSEQARPTFTGNSDPNHFLAHILSYLETPPYLRTKLFGLHPDFQYAGALPSLDMPHHLRVDDWCRYREGITLEPAQQGEDSNGVRAEQSKKRKKTGSDAPGSHSNTQVNVGFSDPVSLPASIPANTRVTVEFTDNLVPGSHDVPSKAVPVAPSEPREKAGYYWGYNVRPASSLSTVLTECPFDGGYDLTLGTSERGVPISTLQNPSTDAPPIPQFKHMLVVFGGIAGLEGAVKADDELQKMGVDGPQSLFDYWVDLCPGQGSRTIRTEEAVWIGLMGLRNIVLSKGIKEI